jgi:uncharacterized protein YllA (UPF0747 family)
MNTEQARKPKLPKIEYEVRCSAEHRGHRYSKKDKATATTTKEELTAHAEKHPELYYSICAPYAIWTRTVTEWIREA